MSTDQQMNEVQEILNILDPDIGHFPDKLAKWIFKIPEFLRGLVLILKEDIVQHLDFDRVKVASTNIIDNTLRESVSDLVFTVPYRDTSKGDELTIYILLEHQSTVDRMMGYRVVILYVSNMECAVEAISQRRCKGKSSTFAPNPAYCLLYWGAAMGCTGNAQRSDGCVRADSTLCAII